MVDTRDVVEVAGAASAGAAAGAIAYRAWRNTTERTIMDGKLTTLQRVEAGRLASDADTFQFKSGADQAGVTDRLQGVKSWNPAAAGKVMVYEYADGRQVIADGHQRLGLARRLMSEGHEPIKMDAIVLRQQDGWQPRDVRAFAAIKNMHESSGASLDMARVMRERPDLVTSSLPISDGKIREAKALARLSEPAFKMVASGTVKPEIAAAVGDAVKDSSRHLDYLSEMQKAKVASGQHARLYVSQAMAAPSLTETTGSLFGEETTTRSLLKERAQVLDKALTALRQDKRIFGLLEREAGTIESVGNRLSHEANAAKAQGSGRLAEMVEKLSTTRGPISEILDKAAAAIAKGEAPAKAARAFVKEVGDTMQKGGMSALTGNAPSRMQAMADDGTGAPPSRKGKRASAARRNPEPQASFDSRQPPEPTATKPGVKQLRDGSYVAHDGVHWEGPGRKDHPAAAADLRDRMAMQAAKPDKGQTSFIPPPTTKEKITAASASKASPRVPQQPMDQGLFGSGMKQLDLVEMAKGKPAAPNAIKGKPARGLWQTAGTKSVSAAVKSLDKLSDADVIATAKHFVPSFKGGKSATRDAAVKALSTEMTASFKENLQFTEAEPAGLRGTQNPNNLAAIVENRQANAKPASKATETRFANEAKRQADMYLNLARSGRSIDDATAVAAAKEQIASVTKNARKKPAWVERTIAELDRRAAAASPLTAAAQSAGVRDPNAAMKDVFGSGMKPGLRYPTEEAAARARSAESAKRMFGPPTPARPPRSILEQSAVTRAGVPHSKARRMTVETLKATLKKEGITEVHGSGGKSWKLMSALGPAAVVGAAAVAFDATRSEAQAAGNSTATTLAKSTAAAAVAGGTVAGTMWGIGKGVQVAGGALAAVAPRAAAVLVPGGAMVLGGLAAYHAGKAAVEGYRKDGLKGAAVGVGDWATMGAVSHFGPRLTASGASQFETANAAYTAMKGNEATNTDSARKPGWGPEARIAAAKAQGAVMLPYGGNPENAPGYVPPVKSKPKS